MKEVNTHGVHVIVMDKFEYEKFMWIFPDGVISLQTAVAVALKIGCQLDENSLSTLFCRVQYLPVNSEAVTRRLTECGFTYLYDLVGLSARTLLTNIACFGKKSLDDLRQAVLQFIGNVPRELFPFLTD